MTGTLDSDSALLQQSGLLQKATLLRKWANAKLRRTQATEKAHHDKRVRFDPILAAVSYVFVERLPLTTSPSRFLVTEGSRLHPARLGPYPILGVEREYVKHWQDEVENIVFITRLTKSPHVNKNDHDDIANKGPRARNKGRPPEPREACGKNTL